MPISDKMWTAALETLTSCTVRTNKNFVNIGVNDDSEQEVNDALEESQSDEEDYGEDNDEEYIDNYDCDSSHDDESLKGNDDYYGDEEDESKSEASVVRSMRDGKEEYECDDDYAVQICEAEPSSEDELEIINGNKKEDDESSVSLPWPQSDEASVSGVLYPLNFSSQPRVGLPKPKEKFTPIDRTLGLGKHRMKVGHQSGVSCQVIKSSKRKYTGHQRFHLHPKYIKRPWLDFEKMQQFYCEMAG